MKKLTLILILIINSIYVIAQASFISDLSFYKAYLDVPIVKKASLTEGKISDEMLDYIFKKTNTSEIKYAIVNALCYKNKFAQHITENSNTISNYINTNYDKNFSLDDINDIFGVSAATSIAYLSIVSDPMCFDKINSLTPKLSSKSVNNEGNISKATITTIALIKLECSMAYVGDCTPMGTQEGFIQIIKELMRLFSNGYSKIENDMRPNAEKIIKDFLSEYNYAAGALNIINLSSKYDCKLYIENQFIKLIKADDSYQYWDRVGIYDVRVETPNGKVLYRDSFHSITDDEIEKIIVTGN